MDFYYVYVLLSLKDNKFYIGHTRCLQERMKRHTKGLVKSTRSRRPFRLIFFEGYLNLYDAIRREKYFKSTKGKRVIRLMLKEYLLSIY